MAYFEGFPRLSAFSCMLEKHFDAIIFDCDGTLVDSEPITVAVLVEYVREFGLKIDYQEALSLFIGRDMPGIVAFLEAKIGIELPETFIDEFRARQALALRNSLRPIDGAHDLLAAMTKPYCVASNAPHDKIEINLSVTGLNQYFTADRTFSAYDINSWKPAPDLFLHVADKMKQHAASCVVIEDSAAGIEAGLAAGMQVIGYSPDPDQKASDDVPFVHSLIELISVLG